MASCFGGLCTGAGIRALENLEMSALVFPQKIGELTRIRDDHTKLTEEEFYLLSVFIEGINMYITLDNINRRNSNLTMKLAGLNNKHSKVKDAITQAIENTNSDERLKNEKIRQKLASLLKFITLKETGIKETLPSKNLNAAIAANRTNAKLLGTQWPPVNSNVNTNAFLRGSVNVEGNPIDKPSEPSKPSILSRLGFTAGTPNSAKVAPQGGSRKKKTVKRRRMNKKTRKH